MGLLQRYLLKQNLVYLLGCLVASTGIYLLIDVFDRLDRLLGRGAEFAEIILYFLTKMPLILSQILPAVFLLAMIVHLGIMRKEREIMALEAGGIPFSRIAGFFVGYALLWSLLQLFFSQVLGVPGEIKSDQIWNTAGSDRQVQEEVINDFWFKEGRRIVHIQSLQPDNGQGQDLKLYVLDEGFQELQEIIQARAFQVQGKHWELEQVTVYDPLSFKFSSRETYAMELEQSVQAFVDAQARESPEKMTLWELGQTISMLEKAGTSVQNLRTAWHLKLSYAFSIPILALLALAVNRTWENMFANISVGLALTFIFYMLHVLGGSLGEEGIMGPVAGAWLGNYFMGAFAVVWLIYKLRARSV